MLIDIVMPQLGLTMTEGKVLQWYKSVGEAFAVGEVLFEVETDKVNMDVEATESGTLAEIVAPLGETLPVTTVIARYSQAGESQNGSESAIAEHGVVAARAADIIATPPDTGSHSTPHVLGTEVRAPEKLGRPLASPRARRTAHDLGVPLDALRGSGPQGRIIAQDVLDFVEQEQPANPTAQNGGLREPVTVSQTIPLSRIRRTIADRMSHSFQSAPHFYLTREIDATELLAMKRMLSSALSKRGKAQVSVTDLLVKALALAIANHSDVNVNWDNGNIVHRSKVQIGLAIAREEGLLVGLLHNGVTAELSDLSEQRASLVERLRTGHAQADDFGVASATLSNLGMYGVDQFHAILNPPESMIVATGRIRDRVVALDGRPSVRSTMHCTVSADHRVLDGAKVAKFLASFAEMLESPALLLLPSMVAR